MNDCLKIIDLLLARPSRSQLKINFDLKKKFFQFFIPIYSCKEPIAFSIKRYVEARKNHVFKPFETYFEFDGLNTVILIQKIPFSWGFQSHLRKLANDFWKMAKVCHTMLSEMAVEEKFKDALYIQSKTPDFPNFL